MNRTIIPTPAHAAGDTLHGFDLTAVTPIDDIRALVYEATHRRTGAQLVHVHCYDEENMFSVGFRTPPPDGTGVAHILEHSVLAGSLRYPVRDAFNELRKRSLATFLNAMTWPDRTVYPVTSAVKADYFHLASVYADLVLNPLLDPKTFQQEGHHLELENPDDPSSPLVVSGVVYNEMKGANSSPERIAYRGIGRALFPDTIYAFDSGGDPDEIPALTYENFCAFHRRFYAPSNARFFFYGDLSLDENLAFLEGVLAPFERVPVDSHVGLQPRWDAARQAREPYAIGPDDSPEQKTFVVVNWLTNRSNDVLETMLMDVAMEALSGSAGAPMRKALISSGLGQAMFPGGAYGVQGPHTYVGLGLRGTDLDKVDAIEALIDSTLRDVVRDGLDRDLIEAAFHQIELSGKSISRPFSLMLMMRANPLWYFDGDPKDGLRFSAEVEEARRRWAEDPRLFEKTLQRWLLDNPHRVRYVLEPSATLQAERDQAFVARMAERKAALSQEELAYVVEQARALKAAQEAPEDPEALATLPQLRVDELPRELRTLETHRSAAGETTLLEHPVFSNGLGYVGLVFDLRDLDDDDALLLPFMGHATRGLGAAGLGYDRMATRIAGHTGGIAISPTSGRNLHHGERFERLCVDASALARNVDELFAILGDLMLASDTTDHTRIAELLRQHASSKAASVVQSGHSYARARASAVLDHTLWRDEQWGGLTALRFLKAHTRDAAASAEALASRIAALQRRLFTRDRVIASLAGDPELIDRMRPALTRLLEALPVGEPYAIAPDVKPSLARDVAVTVPASVNYVCKVVQVPHMAHEAAPALSLLSNVLRAEYLYKKLRVQGGAYGAYAIYQLADGLFSLLSYRDPGVARTFKVFDALAEFVRSDACDDAAVDGSRIGAIGDFDALLSPGQHLSVGRRRAFLGLDDDTRMRFREGLFTVTAKDLREKALPFLEAQLAEAPRVVLGGRDALLAANAELERPLEVEASGV